MEGVTRVIDNPPSREIREANISPGPLGAQNNIEARISPPSQGGVSTDKSVDGVVQESLSRESGKYSADRRREVVSALENEKSINQTPAPYKIYNIGNSSPVPLMEYIAAIEKTIGKEAQKEFLPMQPGDVPKTEADVTDLMEDLGYKPDTPIAKGIENFIDWYKSYFGIK